MRLPIKGGLQFRAATIE